MRQFRSILSCIALLCAVIAAPGVRAQNAATQQDFRLPGIASASSQASPRQSAAHAFDGDSKSHWQAASGVGEWIALRFDQAEFITAVVADELGQNILSHEYQVRRRGIWQTVATGKGGPTRRTQLNADNVTGIRLMIRSSNGQAPALREFYVYTRFGNPACTPFNGTDASIIRGDIDCRGVTVSSPCGPRALPTFKLAAGATLRNAFLTPNGSGNGIECMGSCTLQHISWGTLCSRAAALADTAPPGSLLSIKGGSAVGQVSTPPFYMGVSGGLHIERFRFAGTSTSLNDYRGDIGAQRITLLDVLIQGKLATGIVKVRPYQNDRAHIRRLLITNYQPQQTAICRALLVADGMELPSDEQWNNAYCDLTPADVTALTP